MTVPAMLHHDPNLTPARAGQFERDFVEGYISKLLALRAVGNPLEEQVYDVSFAAQDIVRSDDKGDALRWLRRSGSSLGLTDVPHNPVLRVGVSRKPLFGAPKLRISLVAHCWSPLADLLAGKSVPASSEQIDSLLDHLRVDERSDVYHYIGIASTTGWDITALQNAHTGANFDVVLTAPNGSGWSVHHATEWPEHMVQLFNPESEEVLEGRAARLLASMPELQSPRGFVLVNELADQLGVSTAQTLAICSQWCERRREFCLENVRGDMILRRIAD